MSTRTASDQGLRPEPLSPTWVSEGGPMRKHPFIQGLDLQSRLRLVADHCDDTDPTLAAEVRSIADELADLGRMAARSLR